MQAEAFKSEFCQISGLRESETSRGYFENQIFGWIFNVDRKIFSLRLSRGQNMAQGKYLEQWNIVVEKGFHFDWLYYNEKKLVSPKLD